MPFKSTLNALKGQLKDLQNEGQKFLGGGGSQNSQSYAQPQPQYYNQPQPQYQQPQYQQPQYQQPQYHQAQAQSQQQPPQYNRPPPPPPQQAAVFAQGNVAGGPGQGVYWAARFDPSTQISQEWEEKLGNNNGWGNNELQHYTNDRANSFFTGNNLLVLRAVASTSNPDPARKYTSARLVSRQRLSRPRGSLVATLTLPCASGIWPAFWLLPFEPFTWPHEGEVDIAETWNGDGINHSCLHWGFYTPEDNWKHRVVGTSVPGMQQGRPVRYEFAWNQDEGSGQGRMVWYIDGRPVMKAPIPQGTRKMADFVILLNIAMGGNVTQGQTPRDGTYDFVVHEMKLLDAPEAGGWAKFDQDFNATREGDTL